MHKLDKSIKIGIESVAPNSEDKDACGDLKKKTSVMFKGVKLHISNA